MVLLSPKNHKYYMRQHGDLSFTDGIKEVAVIECL